MAPPLGSKPLTPLRTTNAPGFTTWSGPALAVGIAVDVDRAVVMLCWIMDCIVFPGLLAVLVPEKQAEAWVCSECNYGIPMSTVYDTFVDCVEELMQDIKCIIYLIPYSSDKSRLEICVESSEWEGMSRRLAHKKPLTINESEAIIDELTSLILNEWFQ